MLGAVMFGHRGFQPVIDAIIQLAERAAKEPRDFKPADVVGDRAGDARASPRPTSAPPTRSPARRSATTPIDAVKAKVMAALVAGEARARASTRTRSAAVFKDLQAKIVRWNILDTGTRIDGRDLDDRPPDRLRGRRPAAHPRLGAVHPRRDAGAGRRHARHRRGRADDRRAGGHLQGDLHAALQLPALLGRRDRPHGLARPPRDRPRQARLARHPPDAAGAATSSPTRSASSPRSPSRTARPRWRRCAAPRWR